MFLGVLRGVNLLFFQKYLHNGSNQENDDCFSKYKNGIKTYNQFPWNNHTKIYLWHLCCIDQFDTTTMEIMSVL